jgi:hypothetical protein
MQIAMRACCAVFVITAGLGALIVRGIWIADSSERVQVKVTRQAPFQGADVIEADRGTVVTVTYSISNTSKVVLTQLTAIPNCKCQRLDALPSQLQPGQSTDFSVSLSVPEGGTKHWSLPVVCAQQATPVAVITGAIQPRVNPPEWIRPPAAIHATLVTGESGEIALWESVERRSAKPWLDSVVCSIEGVDVSFKIAEYVFDHGDIVKRQVLIKANASALKPGKYMGEFGVRYNSASADAVRTVPIALDVCAAIAMVPAQLTFRGADPETNKNVTIYDRRGGRAPRIVDFDSTVLQIDQTLSGDDRVLRLSIGLKNTAPPPDETLISLVCDDGSTSSLVVVLD